MWQPPIVKPGLVVEPGRVDHELVTFPLSARIAVPGWLEIFDQFPFVGRYLSEMISNLEEHHDE
jgi:hypothetical protein